MRTSSAAPSARTAAAHLLVPAITEPLQTGVLADGTRLWDFVMRMLLGDALRTRRTDIAFGIVAIENQRSLTMCERNGLISQTVVNGTYARDRPVCGRPVTAHRRSRHTQHRHKLMRDPHARTREPAVWTCPDKKAAVGRPAVFFAL
jgi:hypothetical protein